MLVTIIRPPALVYKWADAGPLTPPLGAAYLASSLREAGYPVKIIDAIGENPSQVNDAGNDLISMGLTPSEIIERIDPSTTVFGISIMFSQDWLECRKIIQLVRAKFPDVPIVAGGEHVTAMRDFLIETCPEIDVCVSGEGEFVFTEIVGALARNEPLSSIGGITYRRDGKPVTTAAASRIKDVDQVPRPAWDLVPVENYLARRLSYGVDLGRTMPLLATRGCPYQCTFCSSPLMWTTRYVMRDPADVLDEIEDLIRRYQISNVDFYDLTMIIKKKWILEFAEMIKARDLQFTWQLPSGTRAEALDDEVLSALYATGCRNITYAPESGSEEELVRIKKKVKIDVMLESMRRAVKNGLNIKTNMILGFPEQTRRDIWKSFKFIFRMAVIGVHDTGVSMFSPYPGTELFEALREDGGIAALDDRYFMSLAGYKDLSKSVAYTRHVRSWEMNIYRIGSMLMFYGVQFLLRPNRFFRLIGNFFRNRQQSRLDKSLRDMYARNF